MIKTRTPHSRAQEIKHNVKASTLRVCMCVCITTRIYLQQPLRISYVPGLPMATVLLRAGTEHGGGGDDGLKLSPVASAWNSH